MKRFLKIAAWTLGIVLGLFVLLIIGIKLFYPMEKAKAFAIEKGIEALGRPITIGEVDLSIWGGLGVNLKEVGIGNPPEISDEQELLTAEAIDVKLQLLPLLTGNFRIDKFIVDRPVIYMVKQADGFTNYSFETADSSLPPEAANLPDEQKAAAAIVSFDELEIKDGLFVFQNDSSNTTLTINGLDLTSSLQTPSQSVYNSSGKFSTDSLSMSGDDGFSLSAVSLNYEAGYDLEARQLLVDRADLVVGGSVMRFTGQINDPAENMKAKGNLIADDISISDMFAILPSKRQAMFEDYNVNGRFSMNLDFTYDSAAVPAVGYSGTVVLNDIAMSKEGISGKLEMQKALLDIKPDNLRFNIEDGRFDGQPLRGYLAVDNFSNPSIAGELAGSLNLAFVQPFLPTKNNHQISGQSHFNIQFSGKLKQVQAIDFSGTLKVENGTYSSEMVPEPIDDLALDIFMDREVLTINALSGNFPSGQFSLTGRVEDFIPYMLADSVQALAISPILDGQFKGEVSMKMAEKYLPPNGKPELDGRLVMDMRVRGPISRPAELRPAGKLSIIDASYNDSLLPEPIKKLNAEMLINYDTITVQRMDVQFTSSDVSFNGRLTKPFPYLLPIQDLNRSQMQKPFFSFTLSSNRFDFDKLFPEAAPGTESNRASAAPDSVSMILLPDIDGQGTFSIDTLIYSKIDFTQITGKVKIYDRKIECYDVNGKAYSGSVAGTTIIDLNDMSAPGYSGEFTASQIEANDFLTRFTKFGGHLFGKVNLQGAYNAKGWEPEQFLNSLTLNGEGDVDNGKLVLSGEILSTFNSLADKLGIAFDKEQALKDLSTLIKVEDGKVQVSNLKTTLGSLGNVSIGGFYGFDGQIGYTGTIDLSREAAESLSSRGGVLGGLASVLKNKETASIRLPLKIGGTLDKPVVAIDYNALTNSLKEGLGAEAGGLLQKLFKK
ncbi:MAG: AsmA family protein [candidate division Zixibacteria bacterium]|nr:AsmA family protein [candidate division Zixibacteria bacterium]